LKALQPIVVAVAAAVIAVLLSPVLSPGLPILVAALAAVIVGGFNLFKPKTQAGEVE
jgi:branched-subunit amino acid ABC-type transport system permease component